MKILRSLCALVALSGLLPAAHAVDLTYDWGPADVLADHQVGPGMKYTKVVYPSKPVIIWLVEIDLTNEYAKIEHVQSRHQVPDPLRWDVMTHYRENTRPGHRVKVAWNHDFFSYESGVCIGLNISEGEVTWNKWGRSLLAITDDRTAEVFYPELNTYVTTPDGTTVWIDYFNAMEGGTSGNCVLYNRLNGKTLTDPGRYLALKPLDKWTVNGDPVRCEVTAISDTPLQTEPDGSRHVLFLHNAKLNALDGHVSVNDTLTVTQCFTDAGWGIKPKNILNAFHGYPSIVHDGVLHDGEFNNFENGREYEKSSRVMAGLSKDKKKLYIATTEMSSESVGVDCIELCAWMVERGSWDIVNFDSGGSAAIVIDEVMLNKPGRGSVRPVQDAALAVSLAPEDSIVDHLAFSLRSVEPMIISRTPLRVIAYNKYDEILIDDLDKCEFECIPSSLGYVDSEGVFCSSDVCQEGRIIARKDGKEAVIEVKTQDVESVAPAYTSLLINNHRHPICGIIGKSNGRDVEVDAGALEWSATPEGIVGIEDGYMYGLANGTATVSARFKDLSLNIDVTVEIAEPKQAVFHCKDLTSKDITKSSALKNFALNTAESRWENGLKMNFDLASGRGTNVRISPKMRLYSLPDSMSCEIEDKDGLITSISYQLTDARGERITLTSNPLPGKSLNTVAFADNNGPFEYYRYPLTLNHITCYLTGSAKPETELDFGSVECYYPGYTGISDPVSLRSVDSLILKVDGETLYVGFDSDREGDASLEIFNSSGRCVRRDSMVCGKGTNLHEIDIKQLPKGIYVLSLKTPATHAVGKIAVR